MFTFNPTCIPKPPKHTQVIIRCDTCKKRKVCGLTKDYRKTATLIQRILGDPQKDMELVCDFGFIGFDFKDLSIFPKTIEIEPKKEEEEKLEGTLLNAKYVDENEVKLLFDVEKYLVMFILTWSPNFERFELTFGRELYFGIKYNLSEEVVSSLSDSLIQWREDFIEAKEKVKDKDIINTTLFSAQLNCKEYEYDNALKHDEHHSHHHGYHHVATYHKEDCIVPEYHNPCEPPIAYPVFIPAAPPPQKCRKPRRRDDINE